MTSSSSLPLSKGQSNLESFLHSVTPVIPSSPLPMKLQQTIDNQGKVEYFLLGNLWKIYDEWSAYGVGIPLMLGSDKTVVQYYTPDLSAIQLYTSSGNGPVREWDPPPHLYFRYDETISPYWRVPFADKISELAESLPGLFSLKSTELYPASWMSVAWCPIYHIPSKEKVEDLSTHFFTFHTLSSYSQDTQGSNDMPVVGKDNTFPNDLIRPKFRSESRRNISLPPFGLSALKMKGDVWINRNSGDRKKLTADLHFAAESWLKQLSAHNHDFDYYNLKSGDN